MAPLRTLLAAPLTAALLLTLTPADGHELPTPARAAAADGHELPTTTRATATDRGEPPTPTGATAADGHTPLTPARATEADRRDAPTVDAVLPLFLTRGRVPAAALLARDAAGSRYAEAGPGISRDDHFRAGSLTKSFVATVVLQLADEHRLSLSDTVEQHLPGLVRGAGNDGRALTLRSLLTHTSGLYDFTRLTGGTVPVTPLQAVRLALTHPPADRGRFSYSNTNYVLLGLVIQQVTGHSYATEAERRILAPLNLSGTSFPGARTTLPAPHGRAYAADGSDVTALDPRVAGAAGELVTTLADLDRFYAALLGGELLPPRRLREMLDTRAARGVYGMGLYPVRLPCGTTVWGHNGRISGSYVRTAATVDGRRVLTFRVDTTAIADPGLEPALLAAEFCPRTR